MAHWSKALHGNKAAKLDERAAAWVSRGARRHLSESQHHCLGGRPRPVLRERFVDMTPHLAAVTVPHGFNVAIIRAVDDATKAIPSRITSRVVYLKRLDDNHMEVARRRSAGGARRAEFGRFIGRFSPAGGTETRVNAGRLPSS